MPKSHQGHDAMALRKRSHKLLDSTLDQMMALLDGQRGAVFSTTGGSIRLMTSRSVDQGVLDIMRPLWPNAPRPLTVGSAYFGVSAGRAYIVLPCLAPDILGLLYVETRGPVPHVPAGHLATASALVGRALRGLSEPKETAPHAAGEVQSEAAERANLEVILERNEWNVSRVARLLGVTRMTIYNRLRRLGVPRGPSSRSRNMPGPQ